MVEMLIACEYMHDCLHVKTNRCYYSSIHDEYIALVFQRAASVNERKGDTKQVNY